MIKPKLSHCLALSLPLFAAALGGSTTALASHVPGVAFAMLALTTVNDQAVLDLRTSGTTGATVDLKIGGEWVATDGDILDVLAANSSLAAVVARIEPPAGYEQRVRFKAHGSPTWGAWSAWSTSRVAHTTAAPAAGQMHVTEFEASTRPVAAGTPVVGTSGYIRIKKLNSGG